jgi:hypothetical protein
MIAAIAAIFSIFIVPIFLIVMCAETEQPKPAIPKGGQPTPETHPQTVPGRLRRIRNGPRPPMVSVECQTVTFNDDLEEISENVDFHMIGNSNKKRSNGKSGHLDLKILEQQRKKKASKMARKAEEEYSYDERASYSDESS